VKIAFVTPEYITEKNFDGGLANYLGRICPALVEIGHEVIIIVAAEHDGMILHNGVEVHRSSISPSLLFWMNSLSNWKFRLTNKYLLQARSFKLSCLRLHRKRSFDLIQYASYTAPALFRLKSVPTVVRVSSYEPLRQKAYGLTSSFDHRLIAWMEKQAIRKADAIHAPSQLVAGAVKEETSRLVEVIEPPFMLDASNWDEKPYRDLLDGKDFLLFFGTLGQLKGVATIAEIIQPVIEQNPNFYFVFIGKDAGYHGRPMIEYLWEKAGNFRGRVIYLGQMHHWHLYPILSHAHTVILPSLIDNLPNTCLEAMACKRVVIGTRGASFDQLIQDGENGFLCDTNSPHSLFNAVKRALSLPQDVREEMGHRAARMIERLTPDVTLGRLLDFYKTACAR
jgi:glycosyltransferase involved in cell wall biosynthesis